ncbi:MAG: tRNA lysidine(34) synthetase TilS [Candidatus Omnitrophota bacterium]
MRRKIKKETLLILKKVKDTISHYGMLEKGERVLAAVSGGADSVSLFHVLLALRSDLGVDLVIANLDHGVRGRESAAESRFVKSLAEDLNVKCILGKLGSMKLVSKKMSLEEKLRKKRYEFLVKAARETGCNVIATGHNMDDQAETLLMRMIKGSSAEGLGGIPPLRFEGNIKLIRPLIRTSRKEIIMYLSEIGGEYVKDSSNDDTRFLRNRVRRDILPLLEEINPAIKPTLANIADSVREETVFSRSLREEKTSGFLSSRGGIHCVGLKQYLAQPSAVRREIFKELFVLSGGNVKKLSYRHWMLLDAFARTQSKGRSLDLPGKVNVVKSKGKLTFGMSR